MPKMTYQDRNDAAIKTCDVVAQIAMRHFIYRLSREGESVLVTEGFRNKQDQAHDYANGTSHVLWPNSFHNHGVAIDLVPVLFGQTVVIYNASARYELIARIAFQCGFQWGFQMWGFDKPHFQYTQGHDITYFIKGGQLDIKKARDDAKAYYNQEAEQISNALKFATGSRKQRFLDELAYIALLLKDCA